MRNCIAKVAILPFFAFLHACGSTPEHTNTLIFATSTKFALDVSASPTGSPDFTLGYKRTEGVWMPLLANKKNAKGVLEPAVCDSPSSKCLYQGKDDKKTDTYSVFASFGANFSGGSQVGEGTGANVNAAGGLAQFFATGIAAQVIANQDPSRLVSVQPADERLLKATKERAEHAEDQQTQLQKILGAKYEENVALGKTTAKEREAKKLLILNKIAPQDKFDKQAWETLVDKSTLEDKDKEELKKWDLPKIKNRLDLDAGATGEKINPLFDAVK
jgi:hypothetical protein